jgi:hypothetical protein
LVGVPYALAMTPDASNPTDIRSIAVSGEDIVAAVETNRTSDRTAVLRVTPPYSGRMRARLHVRQRGADGDGVHIDPDTLLTAEAPAYPRPSETEDSLRRDPETEYTVERHRQRHEQAVEDWRSTITAAVCDRVTLETPSGAHDVDVYVLG